METLRQHHADGRLTLEELTERTGRAYTARILGDLDALATDLPPLHPPAGSREAATAPAGPAQPPAATAGQAAARAALLRSLLWNGLLSVVLVVVWTIWPILGFALFLGWQAFNLLGPRAPDQSRHRDRDR